MHDILLHYNKLQNYIFYVLYWKFYITEIVLHIALFKKPFAWEHQANTYVYIAHYPKYLSYIVYKL